MRTDPDPLVSIVIPAYNAAPYLRQALGSALGQTYAQVEVLVIDDGSTDGTAGIVRAAAQRDRRVRLIQQANAGVAAARNRGIRLARGAYIAPLDADDVWHPEKIERQVACMEEKGPEVGLVYTWSNILDASGSMAIAGPRPTEEGAVLEPLIRSNFLGNASVPLIRRACFDRVGYYDAGMRALGGQGCEDWDLALRLAARYDFAVVPAHLVGYRRVDDCMSAASRSMARSYELMIAKLTSWHAGVAEDALREGAGNFYGWLAKVCYTGGDHWLALRWAVRATRAAPDTARSWRMLAILSTSLPLAMGRPIVRAMWPSRSELLRLRRRLAEVRTALRQSEAPA